MTQKDLARCKTKSKKTHRPATNDPSSDDPDTLFIHDNNKSQEEGPPQLPYVKDSNDSDENEREGAFDWSDEETSNSNAQYWATMDAKDNARLESDTSDGGSSSSHASAAVQEEEDAGSEAQASEGSHAKSGASDAEFPDSLSALVASKRKRSDSVIPARRYKRCSSPVVDDMWNAC